MTRHVKRKSLKSNKLISLRLVKNKTEESKITIHTPEMMNDANKLRVSEYAKAAALAVLEIVRQRRRLPESVKAKLKFNSNEIEFASKFILDENYKYMGASITDYYDLLKAQVKDPVAIYILWLAYTKALSENGLNDFDQKTYGKIARSISDFTSYLYDLTGIPKSIFATVFKSQINKAVSQSQNTFWI